MKKKIATYMMALLGMFVFTACPPGSDSEPEPEPTPYGQTYTQSVSFSAKDGTKRVTLYDLSSSVSSVGNTPNWLVVSPDYYSSGAPSIWVEVEENTSADKRECEVTIWASSNDKVILTVTQEGGKSNDIDDIHNTNTDQPAYAPMR